VSPCWLLAVLLSELVNKFLAMTNNNTVLPNPDTPLAFLPPTLADQFEVSCYIVVAGLSVST
jgi:hypothetical protein